MKRLIAFTLAGTLVVAILFISLQLFVIQPAPPELALATPPTQTPAPAITTPGAETPIPRDARSCAYPAEVAVNFTPQPVPAQPPALPSLAQSYALGYGGSGGGNLPEGMPVSLATELPTSPAEVTAYYRLENTPLTMAEASQLAAQWGLEPQLYLPLWMLEVTPDQIERSYYAIDGMQMLSMWNSERSYSDLALFPSYEGHQYPQTGLPPAEQAEAAAVQYLTERGFLTYPYQADLSGYAYGQVNFYRLLDRSRIEYPAAYAQVNPQGQVGSAWISREEYQSARELPGDQCTRSLADAARWGTWRATCASPTTRRTTGTHSTGGGFTRQARLLTSSGVLSSCLRSEIGAEPYIQLNNLVLTGDLSGLAEYLQTNQGYIYAWGEVQELDGVRQLLVGGWEPFDEFSGYFNGTVRRTAEADFLELEDGRMLRLPALPADVPGDIPLYVQGGLVGDTLEWFILQVHLSDEGQLPPDLSQAEAVIDQVELVYLAPNLSVLPAEQALDPAYRMLQPAWLFSGTFYAADGEAMIFRAYVQAISVP